MGQQFVWPTSWLRYAYQKQHSSLLCLYFGRKSNVKTKCDPILEPQSNRAGPNGFYSKWNMGPYYTHIRARLWLPPSIFFSFAYSFSRLVACLALLHYSNRPIGTQKSLFIALPCKAQLRRRPFPLRSTPKRWMDFGWPTNAFCTGGNPKLVLIGPFNVLSVQSHHQFPERRNDIRSQESEVTDFCLLIWQVCSSVVVIGTNILSNWRSIGRQANLKSFSINVLMVLLWDDLTTGGRGSRTTRLKKFPHLRAMISFQSLHVMVKRFWAYTGS